MSKQNYNAKGVLKKSKCDELGNLDPSRCFHKPIPKNTLCFSLRICQQEKTAHKQTADQIALVAPDGDP